MQENSIKYIQLWALSSLNPQEFDDFFRVEPLICLRPMAPNLCGSSKLMEFDIFLFLKNLENLSYSFPIKIRLNPNLKIK